MRLTKNINGMVWFASQDADLWLEPNEMSYHDNRIAIEKLAAYEDTGLEPEAIDGLRLSLCGAISMSIAEEQGYVEVNRAQEIAHAEAEGRLVILPCKVGDTVFSCSRKERQVLALKCEGYLHTGVAWKVRCTDIIPSWIGNQKRHFYLMANSFGKTVFLTRAEAEAALKEMQGKENF